MVDTPLKTYQPTNQPGASTPVKVDLKIIAVKDDSTFNKLIWLGL